MSDDKKPATGMWAICELFGHRKLSGYISECEFAGSGFIRLDVYPGAAIEPIATQLYSPRAFYGITPTTEELAREFARHTQPAPVTRWELPQIGNGDDNGDDCIDPEYG